MTVKPSTTACLRLNRVAQDAWDGAEANGWHNTLRWRIPGGKIESYGVERVMTNLALIHSEVSEAVEAVRKDPDHIGEELADVLIRTLELAHMLGIDIGLVTLQKMEKNCTRLDVPVRAGGKAI